MLHPDHAPLFLLLNKHLLSSLLLGQFLLRAFAKSVKMLKGGQVNCRDEAASRGALCVFTGRLVSGCTLVHDSCAQRVGGWGAGLDDEGSSHASTLGPLP